MNSIKFKKSWQVAIAATLIAIVLILSLSFLGSLRDYSRPVSAAYYQNATTFRAGTTGVPFWIWVVLPRLFPEKLPAIGGYTALGLTWEPGEQLPQGLTQEKRGLSRVILETSDVPFDLDAYSKFLMDCAQDPRFNPNFLLPEITYNVNLSWREKLLYRFAAIPTTKSSLVAEQQQIFKQVNIRLIRRVFLAMLLSDEQ
ncbi:hypothetical protein [[Limnothrix rosea] IAM M-220]|uniref:hypothetical protein n=1 Tax=[Limnothrix rosea] IAM M-220 TaxID=454133 RepID=UPI000967C916|nr:hypothetical protein [[Limnothrix rosea] IAM M-220]OKH17413.1 hypothetical protein NIES208_09345 [[Limnothrix rosea] IAM M-220]